MPPNNALYRSPAEFVTRLALKQHGRQTLAPVSLVVRWP